MNDAEAAYLEALNDYEALLAEHVPEVLPEWCQNDGWAGAAGAEMHDDWYEPFPHLWDFNLAWCRIRFAGYYRGGAIAECMDRPVERIPGWIVRRALPYVDRSYNDNP